MRLCICICCLATHDLQQVTSEHNEECKKLLRLMGVPVIDAPSEAEAQCAAMAKSGVVYGAATEDMDCLTFGCPVLIRHLMAPASQNAAIQEFSLPVLLEVRAGCVTVWQLLVLFDCVLVQGLDRGSASRCAG